MQHSIVRNVLLGAAALSLSTLALAQSTPDYGKHEFEANCAVCHGMDAKGGGRYASMFMNTPPPDLTVIAMNNGGVFPMQHVYEVVDGTGPEVKAHGPRFMPIWGADYQARASDLTADVGLPGYPEFYARTRIIALIDYLYRVQQK